LIFLVALPSVDEGVALVALRLRLESMATRFWRTRMKRDGRAIVIPSARTVCDRGVSDERVDVTLTNTVIHLLQVKHARDVNYARPSAAGGSFRKLASANTQRGGGNQLHYMHTYNNCGIICIAYSFYYQPLINSDAILRNTLKREARCSHLVAPTPT
jgi:hypothetical protein